MSSCNYSVQTKTYYFRCGSHCFAVRRGGGGIFEVSDASHMNSIYRVNHSCIIESTSLALQLEEESKGGPTHTVAIDLSLEDEVGATDIDISQFALQKSSKGHRPALHAGDIVEYECPVSSYVHDV